MSELVNSADERYSYAVEQDSGPAAHPSAMAVNPETVNVTRREQATALYSKRLSNWTERAGDRMV